MPGKDKRNGGNCSDDLLPVKELLLVFCLASQLCGMGYHEECKQRLINQQQFTGAIYATALMQTQDFGLLKTIWKSVSGITCTVAALAGVTNPPSLFPFQCCFLQTGINTILHLYIFHADLRNYMPHSCLGTPTLSSVQPIAMEDLIILVTVDSVSFLGQSTSNIYLKMFYGLQAPFKNIPTMISGVVAFVTQS